MLDILLNYIDKSSPITIFVLGWLSLYLILALWIFLYRSSTVKKMIKIELHSFKNLYMGRTKTVDEESLLFLYLNKVRVPNPSILSAGKNIAIKKATDGLTGLSIIASTSPFIGLFGTVVAILETFSSLSTQKGSSIAIVAPAISEALVATAGGIAVAILAYSFHLLLKRKNYELNLLLESQADLILSKRKVEYV